jgi:hypothetical protein
MIAAKIPMMGKPIPRQPQPPRIQATVGILLGLAVPSGIGSSGVWSMVFQSGFVYTLSPAHRCKQQNAYGGLTLENSLKNK